MTNTINNFAPARPASPPAGRVHAALQRAGASTTYTTGQMVSCYVEPMPLLVAALILLTALAIGCEFESTAGFVQSDGTNDVKKTEAQLKVDGGM